MNVALVGGAGFIGTRLAARLKTRDIPIESFDRDVGSGGEFSQVFIDVTDKSSLEKLQGCDVIINLAAVHRDDIRPRSLYDDVNVEGAKNICESAEQFGIKKIIFTSSVAVYGFAPPNTGEDGEINYFNDYGRTKWLAENVFREWYDRDPDNRCLVIVRPTVVFGEGNRGNVYNLLKQVHSRRFFMIGNGKNRKSMAYVENVSAFLEYCLDFRPGFHLFNYIDKPDFTMNQLVSKVRSVLFNKSSVGIRLPAVVGLLIGYAADVLAVLTGRSLPVSSIRVKKFMGTTQFDSRTSESRFKPPVSLEEGLRRTLVYEFLENNRSKRTYESE